MSIPLKKYFIVFAKNFDQKKDTIFNVNFFYLKSFNKTTYSFTYINEPFFKGTVLFGLDFKNKMRPLKFSKIEKDGSFSPIDPNLFKKFLLADTNKFIAFSMHTDSKEYEPLIEMLNSYQFEKERILTLVFCKICLDNNKFCLLNKGNQIRAYNNDIICPDCALDIILKELTLIGFFPSSDKISPKFKNFLKHMILKFKNVKKILSTFKYDFNPVLNRDITIYDIEKEPSISKKYLNSKITDLDIPSSFKKILLNLDISTLLPIQAISIEEGLLSEYKDQLLMAPTSGGKTLVGELAGISKLLINKKRKMLYLVPIVALANIRTEEFLKKYKPLNLKIVKKIGEDLLEKREKEGLEDLIDADIIIATYEAIDYILRSGHREQLGDIGTIIIDEIQVLIDSDRGFLLDGLIARLKTLYKKTQFLYLSATVGEPESLAKKLGCILIRYNNRPVPIERHLILCLNENIKHRNISELIKAAFTSRSQYGYKGQSIIFTNTRKKCEALTTYLQNKGIKVRAYHSGLTNEERKIIEMEFQTQNIAGVIATAALAAGVDLPASQVIFESLAMGINWLTVAEFEQMLGRAGRLKKHDLGLAYLLVEPGKVYSPKMENTEENIAIKLLNGKIKDFELEPDEVKSLTELLAFISMFKEGIALERVDEFYHSLINNNYTLELFIKKLNDLNLIRIKENLFYKATYLGRAIAKSFLTTDQSLEVINKLQKREIKNILELALNLKPIKNVYITKRVVAELSKNVNMKYLSNNFFSASVLSLMNAEYVKKRKNLSRNFIDLVLKWINEIFNCKCKDNPFCDCGRLNLERILYDLRVNRKFSIEEISQYLENEFQILIFKGDIIDYLENLIYSFESIKNIAEGIKNIPKNYILELQEIPNIIENIKH